METLIIFNLILLAVIALGVWLSKKFVKTPRGENILLLCAALLTVVFHYSTLLFYQIPNGTAIAYLRQNPNLILPIYPCNVVMWSCILFAFCKNKKSKVGGFLADYIFWFGIVSTLVGMFANVDFMKDPTLANYEVTKSIVAHATLLFNVMLLPIFGHVKVDLFRNMRSIAISIVEMLVIGLYCNLVFSALVSADMAYEVNSMFLIHSPFAGVEFLTYPFIALVALFLYFGLFALLELFFYKKGNRFYNRLAARINVFVKNRTLKGNREDENA